MTKKKPANGTTGAYKRYVRDYKRGVKQADIARKHDVSPQVVSRAIKAWKAGGVA